MKFQERIAIIEIGGSHDECILSQVLALKENDCYVVFCGTAEVFNRNILFKNVFDAFHEIQFPKTMLGDFQTMRALNKWLVKTNVTKLIANTAQGGHIRNLALTSSKSVKFYGIVHTIKMFDGSFTQWLISKKIKNYFVLNDTLLESIPKKKTLKIESFYPLDYPSFNQEIKKNENEYWITIIGGVENRRKDLDGFITIAKNAPANVKFIFLGKTDPNRDETKEFIHQIKTASIEDKIVLFHDFVDQVKFDSYLKATEGIMPLVHPNTPSSDEYFKRQISGAINVAFSYSIPLFIHINYRNWQDFNSGVTFYDMNSAKQKLDDFLKNLNILKLELQQNPKFDKTAQRKRFANYLLFD